MRVKRLLVLLLTLVLVFPTVTFAAGKTTIRISNSSPKVGEKFTVNIKASESGKMTVGYRSNILTLVGNDVQGQQSTTHSFTFTGTNAVLTFEAIAEGNSGIVVQSDTLEDSSISVNVAKTASQSNNQSTNSSQTTSEQTTTEEAPVAETSQEPEDTPSEADFVVDGINYVISERFTDEELLPKFYRTKKNINGRDVDVATNDLFSLVYLKDSADTTQPGNFYIYNDVDNSVSMLLVLRTENDYVIIKNPDTLFSARLEGTSFNLEGIDYSGYTISGTESEFYYLYGVNSIPYEGWFAYDSYAGRIYRADTATLSLIENTDVEPIETEASVEKDKKPFNISPKILLFASAGFILLIIIILIVNAIIRRQDYDYEYEDEDEYESGIEEKSSKRKKVEQDISFETRIISESNKEEPVSINQNIGAKDNVFAEINSDELIDSLIKNASKKADDGLIDFDDE